MDYMLQPTNKYINPSVQQGSMKTLKVQLRNKSVERLDSICKTIDAVGIVERSFPPYTVDLFKSYQKQKEDSK